MVTGEGTTHDRDWAQLNSRRRLASTRSPTARASNSLVRCSVPKRRLMGAVVEGDDTMDEDTHGEDESIDDSKDIDEDDEEDECAS